MSQSGCAQRRSKHPGLFPHLCCMAQANFLISNEYQQGSECFPTTKRKQKHSSSAKNGDRMPNVSNSPADMLQGGFTPPESWERSETMTSAAHGDEWEAYTSIVCRVLFVILSNSPNSKVKHGAKETSHGFLFKIIHSRTCYWFILVLRRHVEDLSTKQGSVPSKTKRDCSFVCLSFLQTPQTHETCLCWKFNKRKNSISMKKWNKLFADISSIIIQNC